MDMKKVNVLESANRSTRPSSPNIVKNTLIGGLIGFALTSMILILNHLFNDAIKNSEDIESHLAITVLGIIPLEEKVMKKKNEKAFGRGYRFGELKENTYAAD